MGSTLQEAEASALARKTGAHLRPHDVVALYFEKLPSAAFFGECASPRQSAPLSCQCAVREACILRILIPRRLETVFLRIL